jgi:membrane protease YdiL (CAAX protease family)
LGVIAVLRVVFYVLSFSNRAATVYSVGMILWVLMFGWMAFLPLWVAQSMKVLRRPQVGRVLREFGLAIPLVFCLILVERLGVALLSNMSGGAVETGSALSKLRGSPNDVRVYMLLIPAFTIGPFAEEVFFRGLVYNALRRRIAPLAAVVLQAFIFTLVHYRWPETGIVPLIVVFAMGVVLAGVYEWRKTLWGPIALHVLKNLAFVVPMTALMILNSHTPAQTWLEAERPPDWLGTNLTGIEKKATGQEQRLYAINTWGSTGLRMWKDELRGFQAVCEWFPDDRAACAQARVGIVNIYLYHLRDFRRAIVQSDRILSEFKDQQEACAQALLRRGWSYYELGDHEMSEQSFREIVESYASLDWARKAALEELMGLDSR